jgi:nucleoside-diphosphate-sugar epimerase
MSARKVLVTGGAGFVGSYVVRRLLRDGHDVIVYDSFVQYMIPDAHREQPNFALRLKDVQDRIRIVRGNTLDKDDLRRVISSEHPDVIIHMAAMPLAALAIEKSEEAFHSILTSTRNILEILRDLEKSSCRLTFASSSMVYGDFLSERVTEDHPTNPRDVYGAFKLCGEIMIRAYAKNYNLDTVMFRPSAVYVPFDANDRVMQRFIRAAQVGQPLMVHGDGSMRMDFTFVEDCADGIVACAMHPAARGEVFNVTRGEARSLSDLVAILRTHFPDLKIEHRPKPDHVPLRGTLDVGKAHRMLGYTPKVSLEEGVARYVAHMKNNIY